jgi:hypothetical protein
MYYPWVAMYTVEVFVKNPASPQGFPAASTTVAVKSYTTKIIPFYHDQPTLHKLKMGSGKALKQCIDDLKIVAIVLFS